MTDDIIYDLSINGGKVISFNPDRTRVCNIGIKDEKIGIITESAIKANRTIDARGLVVSPGFIDFHSHINGKTFSGECMLRQGGTTTIGGERQYDANAIRRMKSKGFIINQGYYTSLSFTLRKAVGLQDTYVEGDASQISLMTSIAEDFFKYGSLGLHICLEMVPGTTENAIVQIASVAKKYDKPILFHIRYDGKRAVEATREAIRIAERCQVKIHLLHLQFMTGQIEIMNDVLREVDAARERGVDITADTGVYEAFPSYIGAAVFDGKWWEKYKTGVSYENLVVSSGIYSGQKCTEELFEFLRSNFPSTTVTAFLLDEAPIAEALKREYMFVSTNADDGLDSLKTGHPATVGTFPKFIRKYVREDKLLALEEAIKKITLLPAERFGIRNKGNIAKGLDADIVVFDYENIKDNADYIGRGDHTAPPDGIEYVIVNGQIVVSGGQLTGNRQAGKLML